MIGMLRGPSPRMRDRASTWLTDTVTIAEQSQTVATRTNMASGGVTVGATTTHAALVRRLRLTDFDDPTRHRSERDLLIWIDDDADVSTGDRVTIISCSDRSLVDQTAHVLHVERDALGVVRRLECRVGSDG